MQQLRYLISSTLALIAVIAFAHQSRVELPNATLQIEINQAIIAINELRAEKGLKPLQPNPSLMAYAQRRAEELSQKFSHTRPNGQKSHLPLKNFTTFAENIATGSNTGKETVLQWKNSKGHYQNMMGNFDSLGLGAIDNPHTPYQYYWALILSDKNATTEYYLE